MIFITEGSGLLAQLGERLGHNQNVEPAGISVDESPAGFSMPFKVTSDSKAALIFCQLIELILKFLPAGLYRKLCQRTGET